MKRSGRIKPKRRDAEALERIRRRDEYRIANPWDEIGLELGLIVVDGKLSHSPKIAIDATDLNHIYSIGRRPDCRSNFICLSRPMHRFFHNHLPAGRVLCLAAKLRKLNQFGDSGDFNLADLDAAAGKSVLGVVCGYTDADLMDDRRVIELRQEVVGGLERLSERANCA